MNRFPFQSRERLCYTFFVLKISSTLGIGHKFFGPLPTLTREAMLNCDHQEGSYKQKSSNTSSWAAKYHSV